MINKNEKLNFVFFGTPEVASKTLEILKNNNFIPSLIITSPDKPQGRKMTITPPPVKIWAIENNIPFLQPEKITPNFISEIKKKSGEQLDLFIVVAYGKILPEDLIKTPSLGTINIHYSLLPLYRGASPLEASLLNGDEKTGVSIQQMEFKLDSGPILASEEINISIDENKEEIKNKLITIGGQLLSLILPKIINREITPTPQDEKLASFCKKIKKEDSELNLNANPLENYNKYRAYQGWPGTFFFVNRNGKNIRVKIKDAIYRDGQFIIQKVTPEGKKELTYEEFLNQN